MNSVYNLKKKEVYKLIDNSLSIKVQNTSNSVRYCLSCVLNNECKIEYYELYTQGKCLEAKLVVKDLKQQTVDYCLLFYHLGVAESGLFKFKNLSKHELLVKLQSVIDKLKWNEFKGVV